MKPILSVGLSGERSSDEIKKLVDVLKERFSQDNIHILVYNSGAKHTSIKILNGSRNRLKRHEIKKILS